MSMAWLRDMAKRLAGPVIWAVITISIMGALRERAWQHVATLNGEEWQVVQTFIRPNRSGDEPICFLPRWTVGHATDQYKFRGIDLLREPTDAWEGLDEPISGFWVVAQFEAFSPDSVPEDLYPHRAQVRLGQAQVYLFRREPFDLPATLSTRMEEADCVLEGPGQSRLEMVWDRTGWAVPRDYPNEENMRYLGCRVTEARFGGRPHHGIWFHPPPPGQSLSLIWPEIEVKQWIAVSGGLRDPIAGRKAPPVKLSVSLDGRALGTLNFAAQRGWKSYSMPTGLEGDAEPRKGRLVFKVWAKNNHSRHLVFDAQMTTTRPPGSLPPRNSLDPPASGSAEEGNDEAQGEGDDSSDAGADDDANEEERR